MVKTLSELENEMFCTVETLNAYIHVLMIVCGDDSVQVSQNHLAWIFTDLTDKTGKLQELLGDLEYLTQHSKPT